MRNCQRKSLFPSLLVLSLSVSSMAVAEAIEQRWERGDSQRRAVPRPSSSAVPDDLRQDRVHSGHHGGSDHHDESGRAQALRERGQAAARRAWNDQILERGRRQYFRAGFHRGLHRALDAPGLGHWDYRVGLRSGEDDREARYAGGDRGRTLAIERASEEAIARVESQFLDLDREPVRDSFLPVPPIAGGLGPRHEAATLRQVFLDFPISRRSRSWGIGHLPSAWEIAGHGHWGNVYDDGWHGGEAHLHDWLHHVRGPEPQNDEEGRIVRSAFATEIDRLRVHHFGRLEHAFDHGFDEGWDYGAFAVTELEYRRGFQEGAAAAFHRAVEDVYRDEFQAEFASFYEREFRSWADFVRPRILELRLADGDGDDVFEPAEQILVSYRIVNYGGVGGEIEVRVSGAALASDLLTLVDLPRRSEARESEPLVAQVRSSIPPRSDRVVSLRVGDEELHRTVYVSYPLEIEPRFDVVAIDTLSGRAEVEIRVRNTSNRAVDGELLVGSAASTDSPQMRPLDELAAGRSRSYRFAVGGLHSLDLLGGEVEVWAQALRRERVEDERAHRLPELAADLYNRDLVTYMLHAADGSASPADVARAQNLMLRRLRADWSAVVRESGNSYRHDLREGTRQTALGDLVASVNRVVGARDAEIFRTLVPRIEDLSRELPGTHPLLRRSMRKLAREM